MGSVLIYLLRIILIFFADDGNFDIVVLGSAVPTKENTYYIFSGEYLD